MHKNSSVKPIITKDGSQTIKSQQFGENYHSIHGAKSESLHVFIHAGLEPFVEKRHISIFEMGFGTGLNALLTCDYAIKTNCFIDYTSIEAYPLTSQNHQSIAYHSFLSLNDSLTGAILDAQWGEKHLIHKLFALTKVHQSIQEYKPQKLFDVIYYDAFSPGTQPELWTIEQFSTLFSWLSSNGSLVTYCAKGEVKRNLKAAGFKVQALPGPPGKREMTRAIKPTN